MESEPRAVPYRGEQPDAHPFAEICSGAVPRGSPKTNVRPRFFVLWARTQSEAQQQ
nr:MAG TPA: hypothetical protein [Caudoviricetes sp.]